MFSQEINSLLPVFSHEISSLRLFFEAMNSLLPFLSRKKQFLFWLNILRDNPCSGSSLLIRLGLLAEPWRCLGRSLIWSGPGLGLGLAWARARLGPELGPAWAWARAQLGHGPAWARARLELGPGLWALTCNLCISDPVSYSQKVVNRGKRVWANSASRD